MIPEDHFQTASRRFRISFGSPSKAACGSRIHVDLSSIPHTDLISDMISDPGPLDWILRSTFWDPPACLTDTDGNSDRTLIVGFVEWFQALNGQRKMEHISRKPVMSKTIKHNHSQSQQCARQHSNAPVKFSRELSAVAMPLLRQITQCLTYHRRNLPRVLLF